MTNSLREPKVEAILTRMFEQAELDETRRVPVTGPLTAQERADALAEVYLPISADGGRLLYSLVRAAQVAAAKATFGEAGLDGVITVLEGDARETLAGLSGAVGFVLLDGWKDLCLPVLRALEPRLLPGTLVIGDDVNLESLAPYLAYVRDPATGYESVTFPVEDGMEVSCRV